MSQKNIREILIEGTNKTTGNPYKLIRIVPGKYEWTWDREMCHRFLAAYRVLGPQGLVTVIDGLRATQIQKYQDTRSHTYSEYQGHTMLVLRTDESDKRPLQFAAGKARGLIGVIAEYGIKALVDLCVEVVGDTQPSQWSPRKGGKGGGKGKGGFGRPRSEDSDDSEDSLDAPPAPRREAVSQPAHQTQPAAQPVTQAADTADEIMRTLAARKMAAMKEVMTCNLLMAQMKAAMGTVTV